MNIKQAKHIMYHLQALKDQALQRAVYATGAAAEAYTAAAHSYAVTHEYVWIADAKRERALRALDLATQHAGVALMYLAEADEADDAVIVTTTANIEKRLQHHTNEEAAQEQARREAVA